MFVAQLSSNANTNAQIVDNLQRNREGGTLELDRFVDPFSFGGLHRLRMQESLEEAGKTFGVTAYYSFRLPFYGSGIFARS